MMKYIIAAALVALGAIILLASYAHAATLLPVVCGNRAVMIRYVEEVFGEKQVAKGTLPSDSGLMIFVNPVTKTFTIFADMKKSFCMVGSGGNWSNIEGKDA